MYHKQFHPSIPKENDWETLQSSRYMMISVIDNISNNLLLSFI